MILEDKLKNTATLKHAILHLKHKGFENIKADVEGYETPKSYTKVGTDISVTPDVVATKEGQVYFFDISLKSEKLNLLKSKWLFLNTISGLKAYKFRLITVKGHYSFSESILDILNLPRKTLIKI